MGTTPPDFSDDSPADEEVLRTTPKTLGWEEVLLQTLKARKETSWWQLAGAEVDEMRRSREETVKRLRSPNAGIRNVAFQMLLKNWVQATDIVPQCLAAVRDDPDLDVRVQAAVCLAGIGQETGDTHISAFLAEVIRAHETPSRIREAAYWGLLRVHSQQIPRELVQSIQHHDPAKPFPIDLEAVRRFAQEARPGGAGG